MSGTFTKTIASYLFLDLSWSSLSQDIPNNRSRVRLTLKLRHTGTGIWFSANKTGVLQGSSFTYTGGFSGSGTKTLHTRDVWVNHNSDGTKTQNFSATFDLNVTYSGSYRGRQSVSGNGTLSRIPRASELTAFSFNAHLKNGTANRINYTVDRKSGNFRHQIQLRDGGTTIWTWDNQNTNGSNYITLSASNVNTLLNRIKTSTTKSFTLRVATRSGSGGSWIGSAVSRNATATVHADVKPSLSSLSVTQTGNSVSSHNLQNISKIKASFSRSAGYGASISSSNIVVKVNGTTTDSQTISSNSGTTAKAIARAGTYEVIGTATDSRGRKNTIRTTFVATAYSTPTITNFSVARQSGTTTNVNVTRAGSWTNLGGGNSITIHIQRRVGSGSWSNVGSIITATAGSFSGTITSTGNSVDTSYEFMITIKDKFNNSATATTTVSTQQVVFDVYRDIGVGIGKMHEKGSLDVGGQTYFNDLVYFVGGIKSQKIPRGANLNDITRTGFYYNNTNADTNTMINAPSNNAFSLIVEETAGWRQTWTRYGTSVRDMWVRQYYNGSWGAWSKIH